MFLSYSKHVFSTITALDNVINREEQGTNILQCFIPVPLHHKTLKIVSHNSVLDKKVKIHNTSN